VNSPTETAALFRLVHNHPDVVSAWIDRTTQPPTLRIRRAAGPLSTAAGPTARPAHRPLRIPGPLAHLKWQIDQAAPLRDLRAPFPSPTPFNDNTACQNEPVQLGCQVQPAGAPWVGTAGLPVRWRDLESRDHWGFLSNWHVLCVSPDSEGHPQHQPDDSHPAFATLANWNPVHPDQPNTLDAAIANACMGGRHTIDREILGIGRPADQPTDAHVGLAVKKSGRTTALTYAECAATGAAVRVSYGGFTAIFQDQDVYEDVDGHFSAAGDSGSAILTAADASPTSLLFAGGGNQTIGCPIRFAIDRFRLLFPF